MKVISRAEWGARAPGRTVRVAAWRRRFFVVHYSGASADQSVRAIQDWCMDGRGFKDIDYNFLVRGTTGEVYEGRGWDVVGSHTKGYNTIGVGVCVITDGPISDAAKAAAADLYGEACRRAGHVLTVRGHRDLDATDCPGDEIYAWVRGALEAAPQPRTLRLDSPWMTGDDVRAVQRIVGARVDGVYGPKTTADVRAWQRRHHLAADGIVGPVTRAKMGL